MFIFKSKIKPSASRGSRFYGIGKNRTNPPVVFGKYTRRIGHNSGKVISVLLYLDPTPAVTETGQ
jgi:hypothetical protein